MASNEGHLYERQMDQDAEELAQEFLSPENSLTAANRAANIPAPEFELDLEDDVLDMEDANPQEQP